MTQLQEIFNAVWERAKDKRRAVSEPNGPCRYRTAEGLKCFAGVLIPDDKYDPSMEGRGSYTVSFLVDAYPSIEEQRLIGRLQSVHDYYRIDEWEDRLRDIAAHFELEVPQ